MPASYAAQHPVGPPAGETLGSAAEQSSQRRGSVMIDSLIHVYDLRSLREITPLSFPSGPVLLQFMPKLSSTVLAAAQSGAFQMVDYTHGVLAHNATQRIDNT